MIRRVGMAATTSLVAGVLALVAAAPALATPKDDPPVSGDDRATAYPGNVTKCSQVPSLKGTEEITVKFTITDDNKYVTITSVPEGFELAGTVVKGGDNYNVYLGDVRTRLHSPLVGKDDKNIPEISHWFACGKKTPPSSSKPPSSSVPPSSSSSSSSSSNGNATTTTTPAGQGSTGSDLADTGATTTGPLIAGSALLLTGGGLLYWLRRTRQRG